MPVGCHPCDVVGSDRAAANVGRGLDQLALQPRPETDSNTEFDADLGHALGQRHRLTHHLLAFGEIDHRTGLDAARLDLAVADQFHMERVQAAQHVARRRRLGRRAIMQAILLVPTSSEATSAVRL